MKRTGKICVLLTLILCFMIGIAINVQAATVTSGKCGKNVSWTLDSSGTLTISGTGPMADFSEAGEKAAPWLIDAHPYFGDTSIHKVVIKSGVTSIGTYAFLRCTRLTSVTIPKTVAAINSNAFAQCDSLQSIVLPNSVEYLGRGIFFNCDRLTSVTLPNSIDYISENMFTGCIGLTSFKIPSNIKVIGEHAFWNCENLKSVSIPEGVTDIGFRAFENCINLKTVNIPSSVTMVGYGAFMGCSNLQYTTYGKAKYLGNSDNPYFILTESTSDTITSCKIHAKTKIIAACAFAGCNKLKSIEIPDGVRHISTHAFDSCSRLTSVSIPDSVTYIADDAFYQCNNLQYKTYGNAKYLGNAKNPYVILMESTSDKITSCKIHANTKFIYNDAFGFCTKLTSITIPDKVLHIGEYAFESCTNLKSAIIGKNVSVIGSGAFDSCNNLASIVIPDKVKLIQENTFDRCFKLTSVVLGKNVISIGGCAFLYCESLESITLPPTVQRIDYRAFEYCQSLTMLTIPASVTSVGYNVFIGCDNLKKVFFMGDAPNISSVAFKGVEAKVYYPRNNETWEDVPKNKYDTFWIAYTPLSIKAQPKTVYASNGKSAKATVTATGDGLKYQWYVKNAGAGSYTKSSVKAADYSCKISSTTNGRYIRCKITDKYGNSVWTKTVRLWAKASITAQPTSQTVVDGNKAKFRVTAIGKDLKYQWQYRTSSTGSWKNATSTTAKSQTFGVSATIAKHGYQYRCRITDSAGNKVYTKTVTLYVLGIKTQPVNKSVKVGATAKFTVAAVGRGLTFQWQYRTSSSGSWKNVSTTSGKKTAYSLTTASKHNGYQYRCKITDSAGNVRYTNVVTLTVK